MVALLNADGYFYACAIKDTVHRDTIYFKKHPEKNEYRVIIDFTVRPGKQLKLDSLVYNLSTPACYRSWLSQDARSIAVKER